MSITARQIQPNEWALMKKIRLAALQDAPQAFATSFATAQKMSDAHWQQRTSEGAQGEKSFCAIAFDNQKPIAMGVGLPDEDNEHHSHLVAMWVSPEYRGTNTARLILEEIFHWAKKRNALFMFAGVKENNHRAENFYKKMGFVTYNGEKLTAKAVCDCNIVLQKALNSHC
ncbi:GNAT family N-acetyltransferase [Candidatus Uabimicrobium amorphum]|uniref:N-acetyltransferase n=1 Tax=Uabimicrobium amorphum TaxID=2596890 RepID=A0A5S9ITR1_UABAM|nr:GNAT family N-acetyltransferase [Candidatus Uabimicrobium amorphum]BBM88008.1 N-acetyltransferase [Candidatus Uabimicrobium amorphum]